MILNLRVMAPNRIVWSSEAQEIILSTNSGQIGILPNHAPLLTGLEIGVIKIRNQSQWISMALMGGFAMIDNNLITILVTEAELASNINQEEAQSSFESAQEMVKKAVTKKEIIEANLSLKRAKARLQALNSSTISAYS